MSGSFSCACAREINVATSAMARSACPRESARPSTDILGAPARIGGRGKFCAGKPIGAGGTGRIDRALRLVDFLVRRFGATGREDEDDERQAAAHAEHVSRVYVTARARSARAGATVA